MQTTQHHRIYLQQLGYDCIPITPSTKACNVDGWSTGSTWGMWQDREDHDLGIRMGSVVKRNGKRYTVAVLDGDDKNIPGSSDRLRAMLRRLGIHEGDTVEVRTRNGGTHFYVWLENAPDRNVKHFDEGQGIAGELRYGRGALVVAPPSPGYKRIAGRWDDLAVVNYAALIGILASSNTSTAPSPLPQETPRAMAAAGIDGLLARALKDVRTGNRADQCLWLSCQLRDNRHSWSAAQNAVSEFQRYTPQDGHPFTERDAQAILKSVWKRSPRDPWNGSQHASSSKRSIIDVLHEQGRFEGRTAETDRDVLIAHLQFRSAAVFNDGRYWHASNRSLAERSYVWHGTAARATARLIEQGWLVRLKKGGGRERGVLAAVYSVGEKLFSILGCANLDTRFSNKEKEKERTTTTSNATQASKMQDRRDVWRYGGLGKSARRVYRLIASGLGNVAALATAAGHVRTTIARALAKLQNAGLVAFDGSNWHVLAFDAWNQLADELGIAGYSERQHEKHVQQRQTYRADVVEAGKLGKDAKRTLTMLHRIKETIQATKEHFSPKAKCKTSTGVL